MCFDESNPNPAKGLQCRKKFSNKPDCTQWNAAIGSKLTKSQCILAASFRLWCQVFPTVIMEAVELICHCPASHQTAV